MAIFSYGFRPLFLAAGAFAALTIPAWMVVLLAQLAPLGDLPPSLWHGHEMLFGFVAAAIGGFLLTAVPSWTGKRGFAGWPLVMATLAWLAGRVAFAFASFLPMSVLALAEMLYLPAIAALVAPPIVRERNRNIPMLVVLALLWSTDGTYLFALHGRDPALASQALGVAIDIVLLLVTIAAGRIVPAFTANALRQSRKSVTLRRYEWIERMLPVTMAAVIVLDAGAPGGYLAFATAVLAALLHAMRLSGWRGLRVAKMPILWGLHLAYAWLPVGFMLKAVFIATGAAWSQWWNHAFGIGVFALMILAVMTRAILGHTGRRLVVRPAVAVAYLLVTLAAFTRVAGPSLWPSQYSIVLIAAAAMWTFAFLIFLAIYAPMLFQPRLDGKRG